MVTFLCFHFVAEFEANFFRLLDDITNGSITSISRSGKPKFVVNVLFTATVLVLRDFFGKS